MASFDNEADIFESMQALSTKEVWPVSGLESEKELFSAICGSDGWVNNSHDSNFPPDYYNKESGYMIEFMRTNDYEKKRSKRTTNRVAERENQLIEELGENVILSFFPNLVRVKLNPDAFPEIKHSNNQTPHG